MGKLIYFYKSMSEPQIYIRGFPKSTTEKDLEKNF